MIKKTKNRIYLMAENSNKTNNRKKNVRAYRVTGKTVVSRQKVERSQPLFHLPHDRDQ